MKKYEIFMKQEDFELKTNHQNKNYLYEENNL